MIGGMKLKKEATLSSHDHVNRGNEHGRGSKRD
jgi:hypothetical protein